MGLMEKDTKLKNNKSRVKLYLRIKAAELLRQNSHLIEHVEQALKALKYVSLIIRPTDSVLTQKKKIRELK